MEKIKSLHKILMPIAKIISPFQEKFGIPHQAGLSPSAKGRVEMLPDYQDKRAFLGIEQFTHLWLVFGFHLSDSTKGFPVVRPPRLGGNKHRGVFATRSPFRPNGLGLSLVKFDGFDSSSESLSLKISGLDLLNKTPIFDIKPYLEKSDRPADAKSGIFDGGEFSNLRVLFSDDAEKTINKMPDALNFKELIREILRLDPRPAYKSDFDDPKIYFIKVNSFEVCWQVEANTAMVKKITEISNEED